jgi:hypothetical protein
MIERESRPKALGRARTAALLNSANLERQLSAYASAAVAAGVGLLAFTRSAEAKIVYTPADTNIPLNGGPVFLDLNHDGSPDFSLFNSTASNTGAFRSYLKASASHGGNAVWGRGTFTGFNAFVFGSALRPGFAVGPAKAYFQKGSRWLMRYHFADVHSHSYYWSRGYNSFGQWFNTQHRYLGLRFMIGAEIHYGWARFTVTQQNFQIKATLTGYAYETTPNKPIITGETKGPDVITLEPVTLGRLAQGASGISAWREKK